MINQLLKKQGLFYSFTFNWRSALFLLFCVLESIPLGAQQKPVSLKGERQNSGIMKRDSGLNFM